MSSVCFHILGADGTLHRKVVCPENEIALQLKEGETWRKVDPLVEGLGVTELQP